MTTEQEEFINKVAKELALAQHQSKNREFSDTISGFHSELKLLRIEYNAQAKSINDHFRRLEKDLGRIDDYLSKEIIPHTVTWTQSSERGRKVEWLIISMIITAGVTFLLTRFQL